MIQSLVLEVAITNRPPKWVLIGFFIYIKYGDIAHCKWAAFFSDA